MGKRLELPSGGIFPERYSSIVAETQEQLDSFGLGLQDVGIIGRVRGGARQVWTGSKFAPCHSREVDELPADDSTYGPAVRYDKYPHLESLPATVIDGQSWVVGGVEYLGVGGSWVAQPSVTKTVYRYQKIARFTAQTQKVYVETRLFDQNLDFDIEFCINDNTVTAWESLVSDRLNVSVLKKNLIILRNATTKDLSFDTYGNSFWLIENALSFRGYTKYRILRVGTSLQLFVNGVLFASTTKTLSTDSNGSAVVLGGRPSEGYVGGVSSLSVKSSLGSLFWDFSNMTTSEVPDSTGNGNTGIVDGVTVAYDWVPQC